MKSCAVLAFTFYLLIGESGELIDDEHILRKLFVELNNDTVDVAIGWYGVRNFSAEAFLFVREAGAKVYRILLEVRTLILMLSTIRARDFYLFSSSFNLIKNCSSLTSNRDLIRDLICAL